MQKPVMRSPLDRMPTHQKQQLLAWLTTGGPDGMGISYKAACRRLLSEFGVKASVGALFRFNHRHKRRLVAQPITTFDLVNNTLTIVIKLAP